MTMIFTILKPDGYYHLSPCVTFKNSTSYPQSRLYLCVKWDFPTAHRLLPYTTLTDILIIETDCVFCAVRTGSLNFTHINFRFRRVRSGLSSKWIIWWLVNHRLKKKIVEIILRCPKYDKVQSLLSRCWRKPHKIGGGGWKSELFETGMTSQNSWGVLESKR